MIVVSDTTPLISLLKIERLDLLEKLFVFFVKHFSLKKASEFPIFSEGFSLL